MKLAIVNQCTRLTATHLEVLRSRMAIYINQVAADWNRPGVNVVAAIDTVQDADMNFYIVDHFPAGAPSNALGYHAVDKTGKPVGYINASRAWPAAVHGMTPYGTIVRGSAATKTRAARPEKLTAGSLSEVLSHEMSEAFIDPHINFYKTDTATGKTWLVEVGDQAHAYRYKIEGTDGPPVIVADYSLPAFYDRKAAGPFSKTGQVSAAFTLDHNCYAFIVENGAGKTINAQIDND